MSGSVFNLAGKVALVTGGSRGIGLSTSRRLLERGASVVLTARKLEGLEAARLELAEAGLDRVAVYAAHSSSESGMREAFAVALERFSGMDIVVNNAATNPSMDPLAEVDLALFDKILDTNLRGYLVVAREGIRRMRELGGGGVIINISTIAAYKAMRGLGAYGVSKAAVNSLTRTLAAELAAEKIRVNGVAPGLVRTRLSEALWKDEKAAEDMLKAIPLNRIAEPGDIAGAVAFLASEAAAYITGQTLVVDGGMLVG
jgi:NAD(P)-dependent dehydrogenase (short-subunit alcohol dehydrogenase family)